jgi:hypothetical protein
MSKKILFQSLLKFRDQIKDGTAKVQDIITDYFNQTGKSVTEEERAIILNEFAKDAPANITPLKSRAFDEIDETAEGFDPDYMKGTSDTDVTAGEIKTSYKPVTGKINYPQVEKLLGVKLRGDESFDELLEIERQSKESKQGIGSLFKKGEGAAFEKIDDRDEVAEFIRNMRGAGIKNPDIRGVFKEFGTDIEGGKRAATTLARAADMKADTKVKQELLSELDEMKMDKGPRFFQEEYMGYDDFRSAEDAKKIEVNNAIVDDLEKMGVEDDTVMFIMGRAREINRKPFYTSGEDFVDIIKEELEFQGIDYDVEFYKNYFRELTGLMRKPEPRFMYGGLA